jgi:hypothetical protein
VLAAEQGDPDNARLVKLLRKQRGQLLTFLYVDGLAPTNNATELAIRPAVLVRKISAGNRGDQGSHTHAVPTSVLRTCQQQGRDFVGAVVELLRQPRPVALQLTGPASATRSPVRPPPFIPTGPKGGTARCMMPCRTISEDAEYPDEG